MILDRFPAIQTLSKEERVLLYCELQDIVVEENSLITPDPEIVAELERRTEAFRRDPTQGSPWEEVRERLRRRAKPASRE